MAQGDGCVMQLIAKLLFPPKCGACGRLLPFRGLDRTSPAVICRECCLLWESEKLDVCGHCGEVVSACTCMTPEMKKAKCELLRKAVYYLPNESDAVQDQLIFRTKDRPRPQIAAFFAEHLERAIREIIAEHSLTDSNTVIVYIPRSRKKAHSTGTDQSAYLAKAVSLQTGVPIRRAILRKPEQNRQQKSLSTKDRIRNARESYEICEGTDLSGLNVILLDDIVTTGASMAAATRLLRRAGAEHVFCVAVAYDEANKMPREAQPTFHV